MIQVIYKGHTYTMEDLVGVLSYYGEYHGHLPDHMTEFLQYLEEDPPILEDTSEYDTRCLEELLFAWSYNGGDLPLGMRVKRKNGETIGAIPKSHVLLYQDNHDQWRVRSFLEHQGKVLPKEHLLEAEDYGEAYQQARDMFPERTIREEETS